jgi:hypothetical protein
MLSRHTYTYLKHSAYDELENKTVRIHLEHSTGVKTPEAFPVLHTTASYNINMYALPESDRRHFSSFARDFGVIFPKAKYEAWSKHTHLHDLCHCENTIKDLIFRGS